MTQHDDMVRLHHMLDYASEAVENGPRQVTRRPHTGSKASTGACAAVEIVGEAATRVSEEGQYRYSSIPWQYARGMRNRLVHGYDKVDLDVLWDTIEYDLPPLIAELRHILSS